MAGWRYFAQRFDGSGNLGDFVDTDLPISDVEIEEVLSGDNSLSGTVTPQLARLIGSDGRPVFEEWGVCIWAESPSGEVYGGILESSGFEGSTWNLNCVDISGVLGDTPYDGSASWENIDPLDIFRYIWYWYQSRPGCNYQVTSDGTTSSVRLGLGSLVQNIDFDTGAANPEALEETEDVDLGPSAYPTQEAWVDKAVKKLNKLPNGWTAAEIRTALDKWLDSGKGSLNAQQKKIVYRAKKVVGKPPKRPADDPAPSATPSSPTTTPTTQPPLVYQQSPYTLTWYNNHDLSDEIDALAAATPFDWHLTHRWSDDGDTPDLQHHMRLGFPRIGRRLSDLRFAIGENIHELPGVGRDGSDYANEIIVIGNGEGAAAITGRSFRPVPNKVRRTKTIVDTTLMTVEACNARADAEVAARVTLDEVTELVVVDHPNAPIGSVALGDEFWLEGDTGWVELGAWVRCIGRRFTPAEGDQMYLSVVRSDRVG